MTLHKQFFAVFFCLVILALPCRPSAAEFRAEIIIDSSRPIGPVNRLILGNNVQWVDRGDELLRAEGKGMSEAMIDKARATGVTLLRYPGGSLADLYHWRDGLGDLPQRGRNEHFYSGRKQTVELGTQEFLEVCEAVGAMPMITVNTATGAAEDAAEWVRLVNVKRLTSRRTGKPLPRVDYWEVGNEPYLKDDKQKKLWVKPEEFARRATRFIEAMRKEDPAIHIAVPLRSDLIGGKPATPLPGFNKTVLQGVAARFDFVALHNAYLPLDFEGKHSEDELYWASVAAPSVVAADFEATRKQLAQLRPGEAVRLAVTEYNAFFTIGRSSDAFIHSPTGALYVADLLRLFAYTPDLAFANFWSLSGNWHFGAIDRHGRARPAHVVLGAYNEVLKGSLLPVAVTAKTINTPHAGFVPAMKDVPLVSAIATRDESTLRLIVMNRDPRETADATLSLGDGFKWRGGSLRIYQANGRFDLREDVERFRMTGRMVEPGESRVALAIPPLSFAVLILDKSPDKDMSGKPRKPRRAGGRHD